MAREMHPRARLELPATRCHGVPVTIQQQQQQQQQQK